MWISLVSSFIKIPIPPESDIGVKARRIMAYLLRAMAAFKRTGAQTRSRRKQLKEINALSTESKMQLISPVKAVEIKAAERVMIVNAQKCAYSSELLCLSNSTSVPCNSPVWALNPRLDDEGIMRLGGRIDKAVWLPFDTRCPILLPQDSALSMQIARHYHLRFYHQNRAAIAAAIRARFWIPCIRRTLNTVRASCQWCKNSNARPSQPIMGQLPIERVMPYVRPFTYTGVDLAGPFTVAIGRRHEKRWVVLFTCMTVRAIHTMLCKDLSTAAIIMCLKDFANRRGVPFRIRSDQGTNFIGAAKVLANASVPIEWVFNTPKDPAAGGCWERMIGLVKKILRAALKEEAPQVETLTSALLDAENLINSRPLVDVTLRSADEEPLTPNHFLLGGPAHVPTPSALDRVCLRGQWNAKQALTNRFWKRWVKEYIPSVVNRTKWQRTGLNVKAGDIVVFGEAGLGRGTWAKGRVTEVVAGPDGVVRSAKIKTATGTVSRPASSLAVLDVA